MRARRWAMSAAAVGAALVLSATAGLREVYPQEYEVITGPSAQLYRSLLSTGITALGYHGSYLRVGSGVPMNYPRNMEPHNAPEAGAYGDTRLKGTTQHLAYYMFQRAGHGVWTFTQDGSVIYTGPRRDKEELLASVQYDVSVDPDLSVLGTEFYRHRRPAVKLGNGLPFPSGYVETHLGGNWWSGSDLIERIKASGEESPVHIMNFNLSAYPTYDEWPEEIIVTKWTNDQGLTFTERVSAWSHPDFDDLFIDEYVVENTGDTNGDGEPDGPVIARNDLYIGFMDRFAPSATGAHGGGVYNHQWQDERVNLMDDWYAYDGGIKLLSVRDGDHPTLLDWDDTGDPYKAAFAFKKLGQPEGTLLSPTQVGVGVVAYTDDAASPYRFNARDMKEGYVAPEGDQPYAVRYWESSSEQYQEDPRAGTTSDQEIYSEVVGAGRRIQEPPAVPSGQFSMLLFGPYDLPPGGKAKIVLAYLAGHPGQVLGNTDLWTWAFKGNQVELPRGLDALKQNFEAAQFAYDNAFDLPDAPPDVNFRTGSSPDAAMTVDWPVSVEQAAHPDYGSADIAGYRVYRSTWFDVGPWELIADFKAGESPETTSYRVSRGNEPAFGELYLFEDKTSVAGSFYHYSVRVYADPHASWTPGISDPSVHPLSMADLPGHIASHVQVGQEGGWSASTQRIYAAESPFAIPSTASEASEARVRVVPNPFIGSGWHQVPGQTSHSYGGSPKIRFVGVPSHCRIQVYSVSGELVSDFIHTNSTRGEADYNQVTWTNNGPIATGVYFWVVENLIEGSNKGKIQRGTLMVVR